MDVLSRELTLGFSNFFNKDSGHWFVSSIGVKTSTESGTISDPESHAYLAFVDVVAVPLNMANTTRIFTSSFIYEQNAVNRKRVWTFSTVESEIPTFAAELSQL